MAVAGEAAVAGRVVAFVGPVELRVPRAAGRLAVGARLGVAEAVGPGAALRLRAHLVREVEALAVHLGKSES